MLRFLQFFKVSHFYWFRLYTNSIKFCCNSLFGIKIFFSGSPYKVWINKNETLSKIENSVTSTILIQSNWFSSNLKYMWDDYFDKVSYGLIKNYGCYTFFNFWECLIFYDSDFIYQKKALCRRICWKKFYSCIDYNDIQVLTYQKNPALSKGRWRRKGCFKKCCFIGESLGLDCVSCT